MWSDPEQYSENYSQKVPAKFEIFQKPYASIVLKCTVGPFKKRYVSQASGHGYTPCFFSCSRFGSDNYWLKSQFLQYCTRSKNCCKRLFLKRVLTQFCMTVAVCAIRAAETMPSAHARSRKVLLHDLVVKRIFEHSFGWSHSNIL